MGKQLCSLFFFNYTHIFARTKLMSELRWLPHGKTKTKIIETNALMVWSWSVESHLRNDNLPPAVSHSSFTNKLNLLTGTGLNKFVSSLLEPPPPLALNQVFYTNIAQPSTLRFQARILEENVELPIMSGFSLLHIHTAKVCTAYRYDLLQLTALVTHIM